MVFFLQEDEKFLVNNRTADNIDLINLWMADFFLRNIIMMK